MSADAGPVTSARLYPMKCPSKKKCFRTAADAAPYLKELQDKDHPSRAAHLGIYTCQRCRSLHIGHNYGPVRQRTTRRGKHAPKFI